MAAMSVVLIVVLVLVVLVLVASVVLGRTTSEVESARDTEYLELEGVLVRYNVMGGGPAVVLVHGWLTSSRLWEQLAGYVDSLDEEQIAATLGVVLKHQSDHTRARKDLGLPDA